MYVFLLHTDFCLNLLYISSIIVEFVLFFFFNL